MYFLAATFHHQTRYFTDIRLECSSFAFYKRDLKRSESILKLKWIIKDGFCQFLNNRGPSNQVGESPDLPVSSLETVFKHSNIKNCDQGCRLFTSTSSYLVIIYIFSLFKQTTASLSESCPVPLEGLFTTTTSLSISNTRREHWRHSEIKLLVREGLTHSRDRTTLCSIIHSIWG